MPVVEGGFPGAPDLLVEHGPTLRVDIGNVFGELAEEQILALVDTGARGNCIDSDLAGRLSLPVVDRGDVSGVHGSGEMNVYLAQMTIPALGFTFRGRFVGAHLAAGGLEYAALIGRNSLRSFTMTYSGDTGSVAIEHP